jgi:hypothetical protein
VKSTRKVVIAILIGMSLLFSAASAASAATHAGAVQRVPAPTAIEY